MSKTPIDSAGAGAGATLALLNGPANVQMVDLYKITLNGGQVVYWHAGPMSSALTFTAAAGQPTSANGTYLSGPAIDRGKLTVKLGLEVATLTIKFIATAGDLINGGSLTAFATGRGFDGATVVMYRAFLPSWTSPITGLTINFSGRVTAFTDIGATTFGMSVSAWTVLFNVNMGPDVFQAGCLNTHYDPNCGLTPTNITGAVSAGATTTTFGSNLTNPDHYFDKGIITFTSGQNSGLSRAVGMYLNASGQVAVAFPLPFAPTNGDTFTVARGCLLNFADCLAQRATLDAEEHFRGQPYTPPAITGAIG